MVHAYHYRPYGAYKIRNSDKTYVFAVVVSYTVVCIHVCDTVPPCRDELHTVPESIIVASLSESHTNHCYEKIAVLMYVCMYVAIRRPCVYSACAYV